VAFKLEETKVDPVVQQNSVDKVDDSATKLETSNSTVNPSGEASEGIAESSDSKEEKSSENKTKEKEENISEATESEKCIGDALVENEKRGDSVWQFEEPNLEGVSKRSTQEIWNCSGNNNSPYFLDFAFVGITSVIVLFYQL